MAGLSELLGARWPVLLLWIFLFSSPAGADPVDEAESTEPISEEVRRSQARALVAEQIVDLDARQRKAQARIDRAQQYFGGELGFEGAFPEWMDRPLHDPVYLIGLQLELNERSVERAAEHVESPIDDLDPDDRDAWMEARDRALKLEDLADQNRRRVIGGIQSGLERAPGFRETTIGEARQRYASQRSAIEPPEAEDPESATRVAQIEAWAAAEASTQTLKRAVVHALTVENSTELEEWVVEALGESEALLTAAEADIEKGLPALLPEDYGLSERLDWLNGLLGEDQQAAIDDLKDRRQLILERAKRAALQTQITELKSELEDLEDVAVSETVEVLAAELKLAQEARLAVESVDGGETHALELERAQLLEQRARVRLEVAESAAAEVLEESATNQAELAEAQARAEEALRLAEAAHAEDDDATAALRDQVLEFSNKAAEILFVEVGTDEEPGRSPLARKRISDLEAELDSAQMAASAALGMAPLVPGRQTAIDDAWSDLREVLEQIRQEVWNQHLERNIILEGLDSAREGLPRASDVGGVGQEDVLVEEWLEAHRALLEVMDKQEQNLTMELDAGLELLTRAKAERRKLRDKVSAARLAEIQQTFLPELLAEFREFPLQLARDGRAWAAIGGNLGSILMDFSVVGSALWGIIELFVLLGLWIFLRRPLVRMVDMGLERLQALRELPENERGRVLPVLERVLEHGSYTAASSLAGQLLLGFCGLLTAGLCLVVLRERLPLLALVFMVWQVRNCVYTGPRLASLVFAGPGQLWPCWRRVSEEQRMLIHRTVWLVCLWASIEWLLHGIALDIMDADRLDDLVNMAAMGAFLLMAYWVLTRWAAHIRTAVERRGNDRFTPLMANPWPFRFLHPIQAAAGLLYLALLFALRFAVQVLSSRRGLSWLTAMVVRQQIKSSNDDMDPLDRETRDALVDGATLDLSLESELSVIQDLYRDWEDSRRRGLVALIGDRGFGKSRVMEHLQLSFQSEESLPLLSIQCPMRSMSEEQALQWMAEKLSLDLSAPSRAALLEALLVMPPHFITVDDLHQSFRRSVGGFEGLVSLLDIMHASSERHFWVVNLHEPAWVYLKGVPGAVNLSVFREQICLRRLSSKDACQWLETRARDQGLRLDYGRLVGEVLPGVDRERAVSRARDAFWRLLVQYSQGNPRILLLFWKRSLFGHEEEKSIHISLYEAPASTDLKSVGDLELFVLTALIIHDGLHLDDISAVLNLSEGECRSLCRQLESRGILCAEDAGTRFSVELSWLPAVERLLQQKHFLYAQT